MTIRHAAAAAGPEGGTALGREPCCALEDQFDEREAVTRLDELRRHGPPRSSRLLIDALVSEGVAGATVLDVGAGVGAVHLALIAAGAATAVDVDASGAYLAAARQESERLGFADRVAYRHGDLVAVADALATADVVTLDRVICCYGDLAALVGRSTALSRRLYGVVYPRDAWWSRAGGRVIALFERLRRSEFRVYIHRDADVERLLAVAGFAPLSRQLAGVWQVRVFQRVAPLGRVPGG